MTGTPSQIEWAEQIKLRIDAEFDRVGQGPHGGSQHADGFGSSRADSGQSGALIPFEVGQYPAAMWGRIPLGSGALFRL